MTRIEKYAAGGALALAGIMIGILGFNRTFFTFGTETDYLWGFMPEAQRLLEGRPLRLEFHPPLYPIVLALVQTLTGNWLTTGLLISLLSSLSVLGSSFLFFYWLCGRYAGWCAMLGLMGSSVFITFSALATSELFFLALNCATLLIVLFAVRSGNPLLWLCSGVIAGCVILARINGLTILMLLLVPWLLPRSWKERLRNAMYMVAGLSFLVALWGGFATYTGSPLYPIGDLKALSVRNLNSNEASMLESGQGHLPGVMEVLARDPGQVVRTYLKDLYHGLLETELGTGSILSFPLYLFVLPGLFFLVQNAHKELVFYLLGVIVVQALLVNLAVHQPRHYLFLAPLFGAAVGECFNRIIAAGRGRATMAFKTFVLLLCGIMASMASVRSSWTRLHSQDKELESVITAARGRLADCSGLVAERPHVPYYVGCPSVRLPAIKTLDKLKDFLNAQPHGESLYLYYGSSEQWRRPALAILESPAQRPEWLEVIASDSSGKGWMLFKFRGETHEAN